MRLSANSSRAAHENRFELPKPTQRVFGTLPDGRVVHAWTLTGRDDFEIEVLTYGGVVRRLMVPDRDGAVEDVVLGYPDLDAYLNDSFFMGATVGRVAGRVGQGRLKVEGHMFLLPINDAANHLHGGPEALNTRLWDATPIEGEKGATSLQLTYCSPDGEQGYPGSVTLKVVYTVTVDNELIFETFAEVDRPTPISLTHHGYFNLAGEGKGTVLEHRCRIQSSQVLACDSEMGLLNQLETVAGRAADLRQTKRLGDVIPGLWQQHGDLYQLEEQSGLKPVARVADPATGRVLEVSSTHSYLQTYFGGALHAGMNGKSGRAYQPFAGFCLECQGYPEATNVEGFGDIMVRPGDVQHHTTLYAFSTIANNTKQGD